jgi:general secretion pathway protein F
MRCWRAGWGRHGTRSRTSRTDGGGRPIPTFSYRAYGKESRIEAGQLESPTEASAYDTLRALGLTVVELREGAGTLVAEPWWKRDIAFGSGALPLSEQAALAEQMATMFRVRLPVLEIVNILAQGATRSAVRRQLERVALLVAGGMQLADAFAQSGPKVAPVFISLLRAGERSDAMPDQLIDLARLLRLKDQLRGQVATALLYPAILIAAAVGVILIVALTLAPALAPLFQGEGRQMPASLAFFYGLGQVLTAWWPVILVGLLALGLLVTWAIRSGGGRIAFHLPLFGPLLRDSDLLTLVRSLALMLKAGWPLAEALRQLDGAPAGGAVALDLRAAIAALERGERAHLALAAGGRLPAMVRELFRIGEETNTLIPVLEAMSQTLQGQIEQGTQRLLRLLTPILTLVIGGAIGALVYSIMGAVLSINDLAF